MPKYHRPGPQQALPRQMATDLGIYLLDETWVIGPMGIYGTYDLLCLSSVILEIINNH